MTAAKPPPKVAGYACPGCGGGAEIHDGHVYPVHKPGCKVLAAATRMKLRALKRDRERTPA